MKLIFLDVDGVLNTPATWGEFINTLNGIKGAGAIDKDKVERVNRIAKATGAEVVISSAWRHHRSVDELKALLKARGATFQVIGKTGSSSHGRGVEIAEYIGKSAPSYVILDDMLSAGWGHSNNFINTNPETGLTDADVTKAIKILGAPSEVSKTPTVSG